MNIYTVGHSTHSADEFTALLNAHRIELLVDVRSFPGSRRCPWFGRSLMPDWLAPTGYVHLADLGGRRGRQDVDPTLNSAWTNVSFRNYADWTRTEAFAVALAELERLASVQRVAFMCSEAWFIKCHRRIISDHLVAAGWTVLHITDAKTARPHTLTDFAHVVDGQVTYSAKQLALA